MSGASSRAAVSVGLAFVLAAFFVAFFPFVAQAQERGASGENPASVEIEAPESPSERNERKSVSGPLAGVEFEDSGRDPDGIPNRILIEAPEKCRLVADESFSLTLEGEGGVAAEMVVGKAVRVSVREGVFSISRKGGGNLDLGGMKPSEAEVVEAEGIVCREARSESGERKARAESEERKVSASDGGREAPAQVASEVRIENRQRVESEVRAQSASEAQIEDGRSAGRESQAQDEEQTESGQSSGQVAEPLAGAATINREGDEADGDIELIEIAFDCEPNKEISISDGASITLGERGTDPEQFRFTDGVGNASIAASGSVVTISPVDDGESFLPAPEDRVAGEDGNLAGDVATVEAQSGVSCGAMETSSGNPGAEAATRNAANTDTGNAAAVSAGAAECPSGQAFTDVAAFSNSANSRVENETDPFTTTGGSFRIGYMATSAGVNPNAVGALEVSVVGDSGQVSESFTANLSGTRTTDSGAFIANLPAGTYRLGVAASNVQYDLVISECQAGSSATNPSNRNTSAADTSDASPSQDVIASTIPNKTLAKTGGPSLSIIAAGLFFAGVGAASIWLLSRRGRGV